MSTTFYPLGLIEDLKVERLDRTILDTFEDGSSSANSIWGSRVFKRRYTVRHAPLSQAEFRYLRSFFVARSGRYDPFWFRDNVHRGGWASVRLAQPVPERRGASSYYTGMELALEQAAPVVELVGTDDLTAALGAAGSSAAPLAWWDANRGITYTHAGTSYGEPLVKDQSGNGYDLAWVSSQQKSVASLATNSQLYDVYQWANGYYATGAAASITGPALGAVAQPAMTIIAICFNHGTYSGPFVLAHCGGPTAGGALGIQLDADQVKPWVGASETWTGATMPTDVFCSIAATWAVGSNAATTYINGGTGVAAGTNSRNYTQSAFSFMGAVDGTRKNFGAQFYCAHVLFFNATLTQAQIKAVHNLFVHQYSGYGMTTV